jgi:hypothetical protein
MHFISFSCLISLTRTSSSMLKRNGKNGILVLFLISEEKLSAFYCWVCY